MSTNCTSKYSMPSDSSCSFMSLPVIASLIFIVRRISVLGVLHELCIIGRTNDNKSRPGKMKEPPHGDCPRIHWLGGNCRIPYLWSFPRTDPCFPPFRGIADASKRTFAEAERGTHILRRRKRIG